MKMKSLFFILFAALCSSALAVDLTVVTANAATVNAGTISNAPAGSFSPTNIPGLTVWLKADALALNDNDPVTTWTDSSGNGNDVAQSTSGNKPLFKTAILNGKAVVRFDGSDDYLTRAALSVSAATMFIVVTPTGNQSWSAASTENNSDYWRTAFGGGEGYFGIFRTTRIDLYPNTAVPNSGTHLFTITSSGSGYEVRIDGTGQGAQAAGFSAGSFFTIGASDGGVRSINGDVAEVLVYDSVLPAGDITSVEGDLRSAARWNF